MAVRARAGAAMAVAVRRQARVRGEQTRLRAAVRARGAPRGKAMRRVRAVARQAGGTRTDREASAFRTVLLKHRHPGGRRAQLAAELQLLHSPGQDVGHGASEVIG